MSWIIRNSATQRVAALVAGVLLLLGSAALTSSADVVKLKDGTVLEGEVKKIGSSYQIKLPDGQYRIVGEKDVDSVTPSGTGASSPAASSAPGPRAGNAAPVAAPRAGGFTSEFNELKQRCERIEEPVRAVTLWETHLGRKDLSAAEREAAEKELAHWKKLYSGSAEKVRNRWIYGEELTKLKEEAQKLIEEGRELEAGRGGTLDAVRKYQAAARIYPNSLAAHFRLAYIELQQAQGPGGNTHIQRARRSLEMALKLAPDNPAVLSNYGACMAALGEPQRGIEYLWRAVRRAETPEIVGNLLFVLDRMPDRFFHASPRMRDINAQANTLRGTYRSGNGLLYIPDASHGLDTDTEGDDDVKGPAGLMGNGSGFFITPDGYLLTNKHVAETDNGRYYRVRLPDKDEEGNFVEYLARFIAADETHDVALLKVDLPEGVTVPYLDLLDRGSQEPYPSVGAQVMVLGYPATSMVGQGTMAMQVTIGTVKSINRGDSREVWFDLSTTYGNSGGPIVDRNGKVVAILTGGLQVHNVLYVQGVSVKQIHDFFTRPANKDKIPELEGLERDIDRPFDGEQLAAEAREATLLVLIYRGNLDASGDDSSADSTDEPAASPTPEGGAGADGAGTPPEE